MKYICGKCRTKVSKYNKECPKCGKRFYKRSCFSKIIGWIILIWFGSRLVIWSIDFFNLALFKKILLIFLWFILIISILINEKI